MTEGQKSCYILARHYPLPLIILELREKDRLLVTFWISNDHINHNHLFNNHSPPVSIVLAYSSGTEVV
jgi:hypothetical protein